MPTRDTRGLCHPVAFAPQLCLRSAVMSRYRAEGHDVNRNSFVRLFHLSLLSCRYDGLSTKSESMPSSLRGLLLLPLHKHQPLLRHELRYANLSSGDLRYVASLMNAMLSSRTSSLIQGADSRGYASISDVASRTLPMIRFHDLEKASVTPLDRRGDRSDRKMELNAIKTLLSNIPCPLKRRSIFRTCEHNSDYTILSQVL